MTVVGNLLVSHSSLVLCGVLKLNLIVRGETAHIYVIYFYSLISPNSLEPA